MRGRRFLAEDINITRTRRRHKKHRKRFLPKILIIIFLLIAVMAGILSFADIGGNVVLGIAEQYIKDNYKIELTAENMTGNPVKGYTVHNFELADSEGNIFLSGGYLSGRVNFSALMSGKIRLAEISIGQLSTDIEQLITALQKIDFSGTKAAARTITILSSPAYADDINAVPEIPLDRFTLKDSRITSSYAVIDVNAITADLKAFNIDIDASVNGIPVAGTIDLREESGLTAINRSSMTLGSGKIIATGGLLNGELDLHAMAEDIDLKEITALYPSAMKPEYYDGKANINLDITGSTDNPKAAGSIDYSGSKFANFPFERFSANVNYANYRVGISNIQASAFNVPVQGEIAAAKRPGENISVMIKLDGSEANLEGLDKVLGIPELKGLSGKVESFSANISGYIDALSGLVNLTAPRIAYDGRAITNIRTQMKLAKSDTAQVDGKFTFEGANGYINGTVSSVLLSPQMNITAKIADLDVKRVQNMIPDASDYKLSGKITASVNVKGGINNPVISGSLNSQEFSAMDQILTRPAVNFTFKDKTLTLTKAEGTLNGMPININGTVSPLPSNNPSLNVNATITMTPASLKAYVPDISQYNIKGSINAGIKVQGSVNSPSVNLLASSQRLQADISGNAITARDMELTTALNGDLAKLDKISLNASAKSITANGITVSGLNAKVDKNGDKITLSSLGAKSGSGSLTGSGSATVSGKEPLNFNFAFKNLALAPLASASGVDLKGSLSGNLKVSGKNTNPAITFTANVPALTAQGFTFSNMQADISGTMEGLKLNKFRADVEGAEISASGTVQIQPALKVNVSINGKNINVSKLLKDNPDLQKNLSGTANLSFNLTGSDKNITGKGSLTSPAFTAYGLKLTSINLPLAYTGSNNIFASNGATAKLYGGNLKNSLTFNINKMTFTDNIDASGVNVNSLVQDVSGGLQGKITGTGKLNMKINGSVKDSVTYSGTGNFSMGAGGITGFKWVDLATRLYGTKGINYVNVSAPLILQTGKLTLKSGSIVNANKNDKIYKYAKLTQNGTIDFSGKTSTMNFMTEGSINYQIVSLLQGGAKGALKSLVSGKSSSGEDFRTVSVRISGKTSSPSFSSLKVGDTTLKAQGQQAAAKVQEKAKEKASEAVTSGKRKAETAVKKTTTKVKDEVSKGIKKGLGGLFKK